MEFSCQGQNNAFPGHITCLRYAVKIADSKFFAPSFLYRYFHRVPVKLRKNQNLNISHPRPKKSSSNRKKPDKRRKHNKSGICQKKQQQPFPQISGKGYCNFFRYRLKCDWKHICGRPQGATNTLRPCTSDATTQHSEHSRTISIIPGLARIFKAEHWVLLCVHFKRC